MSVIQPAPVVDRQLAELLGGERDPVEGVSNAHEFEFDPAVHTATVEQLLEFGRLVRLGCGHFKRTKALLRTGCPRCGEMIRAGWDFDGFRRLGLPDDFSWPSDPLRTLHERESVENNGSYDPNGVR